MRVVIMYDEFIYTIPNSAPFRGRVVAVERRATQDGGVNQSAEKTRLL